MLGKIEGRRRRGWQRMRCWMASPTQWTWVWVDSQSWWCTGRPGTLQLMELQSQTRLSNWTDLNWYPFWLCRVQLWMSLNHCCLIPHKLSTINFISALHFSSLKVPSQLRGYYSISLPPNTISFLFFFLSHSQESFISLKMEPFNWYIYISWFLFLVSLYYCPFKIYILGFCSISSPPQKFSFPQKFFFFQ